MPLTFIDIEKQKTWRIGILVVFLILLYFAVILAFTFPFLPHAAHMPMRFWVSVFFLALLIAGIHFWFSASDAVNSVIQGLNAQPPDPKDEVHKTVLNIMQEIQAATGTTRHIRSVVIPTLSMNALAASDLNGNAVIAVTEGLLSRLTRPQLEAVVAHEAHHILSGDCLETTVAASLFGALSSFVEKSTQTVRARPVLPAFILAWLLLQLSNLVNMFISREREYRADSAAVRMTRDPIALAETLYLLSRNWRGAGFIGSGYEMICIVNPEAAKLDESDGFWADLFSTHPPIQKRIDILLSMAHTNIAGLASKMQAHTAPTPSPAGPGYYAMNPQQQWQGPFAFAELGTLPWLSPLTWVRTEGKQELDRAWKDPLINAIFTARLKQDQTVSSFCCPSCKQQLVEESYEGTQIYQCRFCSGTLVENSKIPRILARTDWEGMRSERVKTLAKSTIQENQRKFAERKLMNLNRSTIPLLTCPKCRNPMFRGFYSTAYLIEIDRCSFCGITWFDREELSMLQCLVEPKIVSNEKPW
jgi:heat shock protein HtpX